MRGTKLGAAAMLAGAAILSGSATATAAPGPSGPAQDVTRLVGGTVAPLAEGNTICPAPWAGSGDLYQKSTACSTGPITG
ncbi:hypothetical protein [Streptomyces sp. NPDC052012]|uniref:hypothetical protein n=1 Tax=Streptomyces sp. NPDC052012 TaxID=3155051 RepID=UPI00344DA947